MTIPIGSPEWQARRAMHVEYVRKVIAEQGWYIQPVFPREGDPSKPFAYTIGLSAAGLPELLISGIGAEVAATLLDAAARHSMGIEINAGDRLEVITVMLHAILAPKAEINFARELYPNRPVWAIQLVWPDEGESYPWDPSWSLGDAQPLYGRKPS